MSLLFSKACHDHRNKSNSARNLNTTRTCDATALDKYWLAILWNMVEWYDIKS